MSDYDRTLWQAEQIAQEEAQSAYRDKMAKVRERSANNAKRKIARLHAKLTEPAFHDPEKGRAGDALSSAQRQVVSRMNKKLKELKAKQRAGESEAENPDAHYVRTADRWKNPRIRHIEDEIMDDVTPPVTFSSGPPKLSVVGQASHIEAIEPYSSDYIPSCDEPEKTANSKRPFLRIVPKA